MPDQGDNVDIIKAEHIDRQKRSMDDHKRQDEQRSLVLLLHPPEGASWSASWALQSRFVLIKWLASHKARRYTSMQFRGWARSKNSSPVVTVRTSHRFPASRPVGKLSEWSTLGRTKS